MTIFYTKKTHYFLSLHHDKFSFDKKIIFDYHVMLLYHVQTLNR